jgi:hypothetical protein
MPRQSRDDAVARRAAERLEQARQRRQEAAQRGAQTRRERRAAEAAQAQPHPEPERPTQGNVRRRSGQRVHPEMVTVAVRGPLAAKMRQLAETNGLSLANLLSDMALIFEREVEAGYEPGACRAAWRQ